MVERARRLFGRGLVATALVCGTYSIDRLVVTENQWQDTKDALSTVHPLSVRLNTPTSIIDHKTVTKTLLDKSSRIKDRFVDHEIKRTVELLNKDKDDETMRALFVYALERNLDQRRDERLDTGFLSLLGIIGSGILGIVGRRIRSGNRQKHAKQTHQGS